MNKGVAKILANKNFYKFGVKLQIGRFIPIYWDPKLSLSNPKVLNIISTKLAKIIKKLKVKIIAGGAMGGISLAAATSLKTGLPWVYIRPEPKKYSTKKLIEGNYKKGDTAILIDDVIASGSAKEIFLKNATDELKIKNILVILDDTGGKYPGWLKKRKIKLYSLFTKKERDNYFAKIGFFNKDILEIEGAYERDRKNWWRNKNVWQKFQQIKNETYFKYDHHK